MKNILLIFIFLTYVSISAQPNIELAIRNIKLGNTYREGKDFDNAAKFINEGLQIALKLNTFNGKYWTAAAYENLGYLYRDMSMRDESKKNFEKALEIYRKIIKQEDGSQIAMINVLNRISDLNFANTKMPAKGAETSNNSVAIYVNKKLKSLPDDIPVNVSSLILKQNRFRNFPDGIINLRNLEYLDLSDNRLKNISENINVLNKLHYLDLSNNRLDKLPASISELNNLQELNLSGNKFKSVNFDICKLQNLRYLNLQNNKIDFEEILKLVRCLPNTVLVFDKYQKVETGLDDDLLDE
jgi:Leucine-rich repeat (LRR) protein